MSRVALILDKLGANKAEIVKILRSGIGIEISRITKLAGSGNPLVVKKLFDRAEPAFAENLQEVLEQLERIGVCYKAYELLDTQEFSSMDRAKLYQITSERLRNMIATREASIHKEERTGGK